MTNIDDGVWSYERVGFVMRERLSGTGRVITDIKR